MSDYIKKEDAIKAYAEILKSDKDTKLIAEMILADIPSADVAEVVRCKDCKSFTRAIDPNDDVWNCCGERMEFVCPDDYCSYGEKKDESDTTDND